MGFKLMENFRRPYFSKTMTEFWTRWHISLSSWIRDYLYTPLALNKRNWGNAGIIYALMVSFVLVGLWHGANWTFVFFGFLHGCALSFEFLTKKYRSRIEKKTPYWIFTPISIIITFSFFSFTCIFFRANNFGEALYIVRHLIPLDWTIPQFFILNKNQLCIGVTGILIMEFVQLLMTQKNIWQKLCKSSRWVRWPAYYALIISIGFFADSSKQAFVYFQF